MAHRNERSVVGFQPTNIYWVHPNFVSQPSRLSLFVHDLEKLVPLLGFSNYQSLMRAYIGEGMRADLERFDNNTLDALIASLKRRGVSDEIINEALNEVV